MVLSNDEVLSKLKQPNSRAEIAQALVWQNRQRFHSITVKEKRNSAHWPTFRTWVHSFLKVDDKREAFDAKFPFPVSTNRILAKVKTGWLKVFDAVNPVLQITASEGIEPKLLAHLTAIKEADFWKKRSHYGAN